MNWTEQQKTAITSEADKIAVASGPGSGKTAVIISRAQRATDQNRVVILITFTNRAAEEMRDRLGETALAKIKYCGPLHKFCFRMMREFGFLLGYRSNAIGILSEWESKRLLSSTMTHLGIDITEKELRQRQSRDAELVWNEYADTLKRNNMVDFDRILSSGLALLNEKMVRDAYRCDDLIIEESQDSAAIDWLIYMKIPAARLFVVADVDQSIFAFRGGYPDGFVQLTRIPGWEVLRLETNFRSDRLICEAATRLISHNTNRVAKEITPDSSHPGKVSVRSYWDAQDELEGTAILVKQRLDAQSIAVLCRNNNEADNFLMNFQFSRIPVNQEKRFLFPWDWQRAIVCIGLLSAPDNDILAEEWLRLGSVDPLVIEFTKNDALVAGKTLLEQAGVIGSPEFPRFLAESNVSEATINYISARKAELGADASFADLAHDLSGKLKDRDQRGAQVEPSGVEESKEKVYVGTIHSAKGHEWDVVFLPSFEECIIPHYGKIQPSAEELEEERRLAFVAVTRARHSVYISYATERATKWGGVMSRLPSRFIEEMGLKLNERKNETNRTPESDQARGNNNPRTDKYG